MAAEARIMSVNLSLFLWLLHIILVSTEGLTAKPGCQSKCGNLTIPYPLGIGTNCSIGSRAELKCDTTFNPPRLFLMSDTDFEVKQILPKEILLNSGSPRTICYDGSGKNNVSFIYSFLDMYTSPYNFSIGCNMFGKIDDEVSGHPRSGCIRFCDGGMIENLNEGPCKGLGCCQIHVPGGSKYYHTMVEGLDFSVFRLTDYCNVVSQYQDYMLNVDPLWGTSLALRFAVGNGTCEYAAKDPSSFACKKNSDCFDSKVGTGYVCNCAYGYEGNAYLDQGCQDVNECEDPDIYPCKGKCINTEGGYHCADKALPFIWIVIGGGLGVFLLGCSIWMYNKKRRQLTKLSENLFRVDRRLKLIQEISSHTKIFTAKTLELATNNFDESRILGKGGYGTVYKGILPDQCVVAIKKSKIIEKRQFEQFINEVVILTKINHRNIVKLLGCSVENEHPLLVYEYVSNGTLSDHLFRKKETPYSSMIWEDRLRIAAEISGALAYLHSAASIPIIHRDVKASNILLDDHLVAKVADFGLSRENHLDQTEITTLVKGTFGYLDPEYMQSSQLTEKSDVYSFGVVLAELLTGKKSVSLERSVEERNLAIYFTRSINKNQVFSIVEEGMVDEENRGQVLVVAALVQRCLNLKGGERPSMKEVAAELQGLRGFDRKHSSAQKSNEDHAKYTSQQANICLTSFYADRASGRSNTDLTIPR
ncbi:hypothetical protein ACHQM5_002964 [Ranunculus cassubicifolius]